MKEGKFLSQLMYMCTSTYKDVKNGGPYYQMELICNWLTSHAMIKRHLHHLYKSWMLTHSRTDAFILCLLIATPVPLPPIANNSLSAGVLFRLLHNYLVQ